MRDTTRGLGRIQTDDMILTTEITENTENQEKSLCALRVLCGEFLP